MFKLNLSSVVQTNKYMQYLTIITIVLVLLVISMIEPDSAKAESSTQITKVVYAHGGTDPVFNYFAQGKTVGLIDADETMRGVMDNYSEAKFEEKIEAIDERVKAEAIEKIVKENAEKLAKEKAEKERKEKEEKERKEREERSVKYTTTNYVNASTKPEPGEEFIKEVLIPGTEVSVVNINECGWAETLEGEFIPADYLRSIEGPSEESISDSESAVATRGGSLDMLYETSTTTSMDYVSSDFNIYSPSYATVDEMYTITANNPGLAGLESAVIEIEQMYGINAYFSMAIAAWESGRGNSSLATNSNNFHGLYDSASGTWMSFSSPSESAHMSARSISTYDAVTINNIGYIYCPDGNTQHWIDNVVSIMNEFIALNK